MKLVLRNLAALVAGIVLGGMINGALVSAGPRVFPPPEGLDWANPESLAAGAHLLEPRHFVFPFLAHALGTLAGALTAHLLGAGPRRALAFGVGGLFLAGGIAAAFLIPAPAWFVALDLVAAYLPMAWLASRLGHQLRPGLACAERPATLAAGVDPLIAALRADGLEEDAQALHRLVHEMAWTTSSELLGELGLELRRIRSARRGRLSPSSRQALATALSLADPPFPSFR